MAPNLLFLTELMGMRVYDLKGRRIGRVRDAAVSPSVDRFRVDQYLVGGEWNWWMVRHDQVSSIALDGISFTALVFAKAQVEAGVDYIGVGDAAARWSARACMNRSSALREKACRRPACYGQARPPAHLRKHQEDSRRDGPTGM